MCKTITPKGTHHICFGEVSALRCVRLKRQREHTIFVSVRHLTSAVYLLCIWLCFLQGNLVSWSAEHLVHGPSTFFNSFIDAHFFSRMLRDSTTRSVHLSVSRSHFAFVSFFSSFYGILSYFKTIYI